MTKLTALLVLAGLLYCGAAHAQSTGSQGPAMYSKSCANSPQLGRAVVCYDTTANEWYYWDPSSLAFLPVSAGGSLPAAGNACNLLTDNGSAWVSLTPAGDLVCGATLGQLTLAGQETTDFNACVSTIAKINLALNGTPQVCNPD